MVCPDHVGCVLVQYDNVIGELVHNVLQSCDEQDRGEGQCGGVCADDDYGEGLHAACGFL